MTSSVKSNNNEVVVTTDAFENYKIPSKINNLSKKNIYNVLALGAKNNSVKSSFENTISREVKHYSKESSDLHKYQEDLEKSRNFNLQDYKNCNSKDIEVQTNSNSNIKKIEKHSRDKSLNEKKMPNTTNDSNINLKHISNNNINKVNAMNSQGRIHNPIETPNLQNEIENKKSVNLEESEIKFGPPKEVRKIYQEKSSQNFFTKNIEDYRENMNSQLLTKALEKNMSFVHGKKHNYKTYLHKYKKKVDNPIMIKKIELDDKRKISNLQYERSALPNQELASLNGSYINRNIVNNSELYGKTIYYAELDHPSLPITNNVSFNKDDKNEEEEENNKMHNQFYNTNINKFKLQDRNNHKTLDPNFFIKNKTSNSNGVYHNYMNFKTNQEIQRLPNLRLGKVSQSRISNKK